MNTDFTQPNWNHARTALAVAETLSFTAAAKQLNQTQPTISRQIAQLEEQLGMLLFNRIGTGLTLTPAATELLPYLREMAAAANSLSLRALSQSENLSGNVTISVSENFAAKIMPEILQLCRENAPNISITVSAENEVENLMTREADIALRHIRPTQPDLIARHITDFDAYLYAAHCFLASYGVPRDKTSLQNMSFIGAGDNEAFIEYLRGHCIQISEKNIKYSTNSLLVFWEFVKAGIGIGFMANALVSKSDNVTALLPEEIKIRFPLWLVSHRELQMNKRIRLVYDLIARHFENHYRS